jgi:tetratricopeptide (TPR) repeat protein
MLIAVVPVLLFLLIVKFDIGAAKDWDVFAPYTLLLGCLALVVFFPSETDEKKRAFLIVATVTLLHSLTFFVLNASVQPSVKRYESFFNTKTLSNFGFYSSSLGLALYHHQMKNESEVIRIWERYIAHYPADGRGYSNIITNLKNFGTDSVDRIEETFRRWLTANPDDSTALISYSRFSLDLGNFSFNEGQLENARMFYTRAIYFDQQYARGFNNLGSVYAQEGKFDTAKVLFEKAISIDSNYAEAYYNLGSVYDDMKNRKAAIRNYIKSADLGNTAATEKLKNMETP